MKPNKLLGDELRLFSWGWVRGILDTYRIITQQPNGKHPS